MNGYNFTESVRQALAHARTEASKLGHEYVGTEHELLGLLVDDHTATVALRNLGVEPEALRAQVLSVLAPDKKKIPTGPDLAYTSRAKKALALSMSEARELNHNYVGTEHLLLGLLREKKGIAAQALTASGVSLHAAREEILAILGDRIPVAGNFHAGPRAANVGGIQATTGASAQYNQRMSAILGSAIGIAKARKSADISLVHMTIALLSHGQGMANAALDALRFRRDDALPELEALAPIVSTEAAETDIPRLSPAVMSVLQAVDAHAERLSASPGSQHVLLYILRSSADVASVFAKQQVTEESLTEAIDRVSG